MATVAPLVGRDSVLKRAQIEVHDDGLRHSVRIGERQVVSGTIMCTISHSYAS